MPLTTTQTQVLASHLAALRSSLEPNRPSDRITPFTPTDVLTSMVLELGPAALPMICECICCNPIQAEQIDKSTRDCICDLCDQCTCELEICIKAETAPGRIFNGLIAKLLKQLWPILVKIFMDFLEEENTSKRSSLEFSLQLPSKQ